MVRIKYLNSAKLDLKEIYKYIALDSKRYAKLQVEKIYMRIESLKNNISIGKTVEELQNPLVKEIVEGNYRIIYKIISDDEIHILMIHHGARSLTRRV